jgi:hypothetical protein
MTANQITTHAFITKSSLHPVDTDRPDGPLIGTGHTSRADAFVKSSDAGRAVLSEHGIIDYTPHAFTNDILDDDGKLTHETAAQLDDEFSSGLHHIHSIKNTGEGHVAALEYVANRHGDRVVISSEFRHPNGLFIDPTKDEVADEWKRRKGLFNRVARVCDFLVVHNQHNLDDIRQGLPLNPDLIDVPAYQNAVYIPDPLDQIYGHVQKFVETNLNKGGDHPVLQSFFETGELRIVMDQYTVHLAFAANEFPDVKQAEAHLKELARNDDALANKLQVSPDDIQITLHIRTTDTRPDKKHFVVAYREELSPELYELLQDSGSFLTFLERYCSDLGLNLELEHWKNNADGNQRSIPDMITAADAAQAKANLCWIGGHPSPTKENPKRTVSEMIERWQVAKGKARARKALGHGNPVICGQSHEGIYAAREHQLDSVIPYSPGQLADAITQLVRDYTVNPVENLTTLRADQDKVEAENNHARLAERHARAIRQYAEEKFSQLEAA